MPDVEAPSASTGSRSRHASLVAAIDAQAKQHPASVALDDRRRRLTYEELAELSHVVAGNLHRAGVRAGDRVAVSADKRVENVAAMLGILRCGAAFVPLDPAAPQDRLRDLVEDAAPGAVVGKLPAPPSADCAALSMEAALAGAGRPFEEGAEVEGDTVAYCMYTSGSSGRPKGVQIDHAALLAFIADIDPLMRVDERSRCLNTSPFFFDVSVVDVWYPLAKGATVHLTDPLLVPDRILDRMEQEAMTHFSAVGSVLSLLRRAGRPLADRDLSSVTQVMTGAEIVDPATVHEWLDAMPGATVFNGYGPTEATCCCFAHPITIDNRDRAPYPIGRPFPQTHVLIVDPEGEACPPGLAGELLLSGLQVSRGYLGRPEEDRRRFVERDGRRWYRTGDLVLCDENGDFHFRGRRDHELKVRGFRIHPAEITAALHRCEGVAAVHVTTILDDRGQRSVAAAVVPAETMTLDEEVLRREARAKLPEYMVPRRILVVPSLPKLPSGKVDDREVARLFAAGSE